MERKEPLLGSKAGGDYGSMGIDYDSMRSVAVNGSQYLRYDHDQTNRESAEYSNKVVTSNYTVFTFLPKNLYEQFSNVANLYFLAIGVLQIFPEITTTDGIPTMYESLSFIILVGMLRAGSEDWHKHKADAIRNRSPYWVLDASHVPKEPRDDNYGFVEKECGDLMPGDILKVHKNQMIPADVLVLATSDAKGACFIDKANLNGETKLEVVYSIEETRGMKTPDDLETLNIRLFYEQPNGKFDSFKSFLEINPALEGFQASNQAPVSHDVSHIELGMDKMLLRETNLRNTDWVYCLVVYTGQDTRIQMSNNAGEVRALKKSKIMRYVDTFLFQMLIFQSILCLIGGIYCAIWTAVEYDVWYLRFDDPSIVSGFEAFFTWYILLCQMVPIALIVSAEMVKFIASTFVQWDATLFSDTLNKPIACNSSVIHEELGFVDYIFSDKTGTLTQNKMEFRWCLLDQGEFGSADTEISRSVAKRQAELDQKQAGKLGVQAVPWTQLTKSYQKKSQTNYSPEMDCLESTGLIKLWAAPPEDDFDIAPAEDDDDDSAQNRGEFSSKERKELLTALWGAEDAQTIDEKHNPVLFRYMLHMALSNTVVPYQMNGELKFQSESAEEAAMVQWAHSLGFTKTGVNPTRLEIAVGNDTLTRSYTHLATFGFTSKRARVTVLYQEEGSNMLQMMTKGQDTVVLPLLDEMKDENKVLGQLKNANAKGARTLVCGYAELPIAWWNDSRAEQYKTLLRDDTEEGKTKFAKFQSDTEQAAKLAYLGCLGFEDQLQELVPETIKDCLRAGVKVWMITGDKLETAKNIGLACNLIDPDMLPQLEDGASVADILSAGHNSRLVEVTGQWAQLAKDSEELGSLFDLFDVDKDGILTLDELLVCLQALKYNISKESLVSKLAALNPRKQRAEESLTKQEFVQLMRGSRLSAYDAVTYDINEGLRQYQAITDHELYPISVLINRDAFKVMFPEAGSRLPVGLTEEDLETLRVRFFLLASVAKSVIFARAQPAMKKRMVTEIMKREPKATTLAIGDGANDTDMIRAAHIGVGIAGIEGTAATSSADYAFGTFRYVHTLLFVHGYWSSHRIAILVNFIFYKACLLALTQYYIGFCSGFSGQQFFNDPIYQLFNLLFTAAPVMVIGILEQPLPRGTLENNPSVYDENRGVVYRRRHFYAWIARAILHSFCCFLIPMYAFGWLDPQFPDGRLEGLWFQSTVSYFAVCLVPTYIVIYEMKSMTILHHLSIWGSLLCIVFFVWFYNIFDEYNPQLYGVVDRILVSPLAWFTILLTTVIPILIEHTYRSIDTTFFPSYTQVIQEKLMLHRQKTKHERRLLEDAVGGGLGLSVRKMSGASRKVIQTLQDEKEWREYKRTVPEMLPRDSPKKQNRQLPADLMSGESQDGLNSALLRSMLYLRHLNTK